MRVAFVVAGSAAAMIGLGVLPSFSADLSPPPPVVEYDEEDEPIAPVAAAPVVVAPFPPAPVVGPPAYVFEDDSYCWYRAGWRGPGWYVCDYGPWVTGRWWGGPAGWNGWAWRGGPRFHDRPYVRPGAGFGPRPSYARGGYGGFYERRGHWRGRYR